MNQKITLLIFIITLLFISGQIKTQVTIGSGIPPQKGALLELKEYDDGENNTTATRGILLPRVELTDKYNLFPMFKDDEDYISNKDGKKDSEDLNHKGMIVYNINPMYCDNMFAGPYSWDGEKWNNLGENKFLAETDQLVDNRDLSNPEYYRIAKFGKAGWWMTENLRATKSPDGTDLIRGKRLDVNPGDEDFRYWYPRQDEQLFNKNPEYGYIYNFYAAVGLTQAQLDVGDASISKTQGICPDGWHLPDWDEWKELYNAITENPCKYGYTDDGSLYGYIMQTKDDTPNGLSRIPEEGGFNAPLLHNAVNGPSSGNYDDWFMIWLSDPGTGGQPLNHLSGILLHNDRRAAMYKPLYNLGQLSVRCKKNVSPPIKP